MNSMLSVPNPTRWSDRLTFEVALALEGSGEPMDSIRKTYGYTAIEFIAVTKDPVFLRKVEHYRGEIREKGMTFKLKARAQAEELLSTSWQLIHDTGVSPAVKADLIKSTVKWAGLDAVPDGPQGGGTGGVRININFGGTTSSLTLVEDSIEHDPEEV